MLLQPYKSNSILDMIKEVESHESINHWTLMKNSEANNNQGKIIWEAKEYFICLVFQSQDISRYIMNETQIHHLWTWINETMGSQLLVKLCYSGKLDKREVTISYSKYTWIVKQINLLCTFLYPIWYWCGCLHGDSFRNFSWCKNRIMCPKVKKITLCTKEIKWKLVWYSKNWSRN